MSYRACSRIPSSPRRLASGANQGSLRDSWRWSRRWEFAENLTDRQAAESVRARIDWKYSLGLELTDPGFDHTVLTGFRQRLIDHGLEKKVLDLLLARCSELGLVTAGGRQRTDSTRVLAAVRSVNRLEFLTETLRAALEALAAAAPEWLRARIDPEWVARYGARADSYRLPAGQDKRAALARQAGVDGFALLETVHAGAAPVWLREIPAVITLRTVWITQYHRTITGGRQEVAWREEKDLPPSRDRLCSPYDTDARFATKRGSGWEGYKIHISETCDDVTETGLPHLVTNVATTDARRHRRRNARGGPCRPRPPKPAARRAHRGYRLHLRRVNGLFPPRFRCQPAGPAARRHLRPGPQQGRF